MEQDVLRFLMERKVIAIVRGVSSEKMPELVRAMADGGVRCVEVTFDQSSEEKQADTLRAIRVINERFGEEVCAGAGTVMTAEQVRLAREAGAKYIISPNVNEAVIRETKKQGLVSIPGAFTATEVAAAYEYGADIVKLFPAAILGPAYVKALRAPLKHIPMTAVGGVSPENCASFIEAGCCGVGCGGNLVSTKLVEAGRFDEITATARAYCDALGV